MQETKESPFARSPTLETVLMIERFIEEHSGEFNRTELWKKLPRKVMWQTFVVVINYLEKSNKILVKEEKIIWIWNPRLIRRLEEQDLLKNERTH